MSERADTEDGFPSGCKYNDLLIEAFGVSGQHGRMGVAEEQIRKLEEEMQLIKTEQTRMGIKLAIYTGSGSLLGGAGVALLIKLLSGS